MKPITLGIAARNKLRAAAREVMTAVPQSVITAPSISTSFLSCSIWQANSSLEIGTCPILETRLIMNINLFNGITYRL